MKVVRARTAGFCLGVSLALRCLDRELESVSAGAGQRLITLGPIIHNPLVMRHYARMGVLCETDISRVASGDRVVIRAHGIPRGMQETLAGIGAKIVDATCPKVKKAQKAIGKQYANGGTLLLFGEREHPEVRGLLSYAGEQAQVFGSLEDLAALELDPDKPYFLAAQTTQESSTFARAREKIRRLLGRDIPFLDTICDATRKRQQEATDLSSSVTALVVVGGFNSGNTKRLAEVAAGHGVVALHVEQPSDLSADCVARIRQSGGPVGLTAGASTPDEHIAAVEAFLLSL
ncbi:MAG: 4-hydroxy-3-methylbut-2-enyl diphosphate reductase [Desulfovibrio sp.]|jgi:4-hydroxy-3-methylbut-2-enyl diphosphate reductase|nr:4-hydroxy-3-methylbut-2-enyl diphosphate reductase [Desulfovibrio sp.]